MMMFVVCVTLSACKPEGIDDKTYELGKDAIELAQDYLDGKLPTQEAKEKMHDIYEKLDALEFDPKEEHRENHHNGMVEAKVFKFVGDMLGIHTDYEIQKSVEKDLKELKDYLGIK